MDDHRDYDATSHDEAPVREKVVQRRRRPPLSCSECRRRKLKCDRSLPCGQCIRSKTAESCTFVGSQPGDLLKTSRRISPSNARHQRPHGQVDQQTGAGSMFVFDSRLNAKSTPDRVSKNSQKEDLHELRQRLRSLERAMAKSVPAIQTPETTAHDTLSETTTSQTGPGAMYLEDRIRFLPDSNFRGKKGKTRYFGRSNWCTTASFFQDIGTFMRQKHNNESYRDYHSMKKYKHEIWTRESQEHQRAFREQAFEIEEMVPSRAIADQLVQLYLDSFETTYRVLHVPSFLKQYADYWANPQKPDIAFVAQLLAIMAAGTRFLPTSSSSGQPNAYQHSASKWIMAIQSYISCTSISPHINFKMVQTQTLLLLAQLANATDSELAWISSGALVRSAMTLGLHRDPGRFRKATAPFWSELRRRLWTTIVELDLKIALDRGMTPSIDLDECDCNLPSDIDDADIVEDMKHEPSPTNSTRRTQNIYQCLLSKSLDLRWRVVKKVNALRFSLSYDEALQINEELSRFLKTGSDCLNDHVLSSDASSSVRHQFAQSLHQFTIQKFVLALHRPFSLSVARLPKCSYSRKICLETSLEILSQMQLPAPGEIIVHPHIKQLASGMFCDDVFHAAITVCVELSLQAQEMGQSSGSRIDNINPSVLLSMVQSQQSVMLQAIERTLDDFGRTILCGSGRGSKPFFFFSMILASAKSRIKGEDPMTELDAVSKRAVQIGRGIISGLSYEEALACAMRPPTQSPDPPIAPFGTTPISASLLDFDFPSLLSTDFGGDLATLDLNGWFDGVESGGSDAWNGAMFADLPQL
ncbi:hypothetical protein POX_d05889 [Penicillium oxalicum]|uniref:hypothetical protein n=1 Tax=Penicillium oxalicum TaxID=69781 RepID=UPI0020B8AB8B|nr:hypothetical protein POX_d05889 [Penicillium oxalicum]KAI2790378.1 hypothetical protein POX_d05889 [Penicillium oxalicum]